MIASGLLSDAVEECQPFVCAACGANEGETLCRGIRDWEYGVTGEWAHVRCSCCNTVSLHPLPDERTIRAAYPDDYASWTEQSGGQTLLHKLRAIYITHRDRRLARLIPEGGAVLDVGCGDGATLERVNRLTAGRVVGIDLSPHAVAVARDKGLEVHCGTLDTLPADPEAFDLILMIDYLEHSWSPKEDLATSYRLLKPGGKLLGVAPNYASLDRWLFGRYWAGTHAPRHLLQFTPQTLGSLLEGQGFNRPQFSYLLAPSHVAISIQNWLQSGAAGRTLQTRLEHGRAAYYPILLAAAVPFQTVLSILGLGSLMRFTAEKG